jgi:D-beta-D-heptose 7-phosphate kinase/D-beta-D-heptose 1-phosphate adenosyltransferase
MNINISKFDQTHLLVIGDLMIDEYVWGKVERISPEAPVQVVAVQNQDYTLGGSGNVIHNLVTLGARVTVLGVVGKDSDGKLLIDQLDAIGADTGGVIQNKGRHTTKKTRIIAEHQQVLRVDRETKSEIAAQIFKRIVKKAEQIIPDVDLVLISDYGKGLVSRAMIKSLVQIAKAHGKILIADPKGLDFTKYAGVDLLTPNKKEASLASGREISDTRTLTDVGGHLLDKSGVEKLLITCGKDGMVLFEKNCKPFKIDTRAREVYDVSGAGEALRLSASDTPPKHTTLRELSELCRKLQKRGKRIVLTNGCFDLLHVGHIKLFADSKSLGDVLIVALDDDDSVRRLKGADRPVIGAAERVRILSALDSVDHVMVFDTSDLDKVIERIRPDILTKGSNYDSEKVLGRDIVERYGGRVELIPVTDGISSTRIINTIKKQ